LGLGERDRAGERVKKYSVAMQPNQPYNEKRAK
jgi:hypothetical protein